MHSVFFGHGFCYAHFTLQVANALAAAPELDQEKADTGNRNTVCELPSRSAQAAFDKGTVQFIGNAALIIRYAGFAILTDPNFLHKGDRAHLGYGLKSKRLTEPAIPWKSCRRAGAKNYLSEAWRKLPVAPCGKP